MREQMIAAGLWDESDPRDPSESIAAAWQVVEHLRAVGVGLIVKAFPVGMQTAYSANVPGTSIGWSAATAPEAICRAALKAMGE